MPKRAAAVVLLGLLAAGCAPSSGPLYVVSPQAVQQPWPGTLPPLDSRGAVLTRFDPQRSVFTLALGGALVDYRQGVARLPRRLRRRFQRRGRRSRTALLGAAAGSRWLARAAAARAVRRRVQARPAGCLGGGRDRPAARPGAHRCLRRHGEGGRPPAGLGPAAGPCQ